jgi:prepilin-type N-terminal cleavage/methylation domain-containing protein
MRRIPTLQRDSGFTLIELVISIVLLGILAAVGSSMIVDSFTTSRMVNAEIASESQARYALERLAREIREIKYASSSTTPTTSCSDGTTDKYCIATNTTTKLIFTNGAGVTVTIDTLIINFNSSNMNLRLTYSTDNVIQTLCTNVSLFTLAYYMKDGVTTASVTSDVRFVGITLTRTDLTSGQGISQRIRVALRNA